MAVFGRLVRGMQALFRRAQSDDALDAELEAFVEAAVEQKMRHGLSRAEAVRAVRVETGSVEAVKDRVRDVGWESSVHGLVQDVRYALRSMRRAPGFAAIAVGSSALGIGAGSLLFAILNTAVLTPLPVERPRRLMRLSEVDRRTGEAGSDLSYPDYLDLRRAQAFDGVTAFEPLFPASLGVPGEPQRHWGTLATANYFDVVKPRFAIGRGFDANRDDSPGAPPVVVLSHDLWRAHFGRDPAIVGRTVSINTRLATIIGVTEAGFRGTDVGVDSAFWIPFSMLGDLEARRGPVSQNRRRYWLEAVARLRPDVDARSARAELDTIARTLNSTFSRDESRGFHLERAGQIDLRLRSITLTLFLLSLGATVLVLLTACANVANLLLGRASARTGEIAARMALGASRGRLIRQLLTESLVLSLLGGAGGLVIAAYGTAAFRHIRTPLGWPIDLPVSLDYTVLAFCVGLSVVTGIVFGLTPALRATKRDLAADLRTTARGIAGGSRFGLRNILVVAQVAICTLLLLCTGLFLRSLNAARGMDVGLDHANLLLLAFDPALQGRADPESRRMLRQILDEANAVPGIRVATLTTDVPLTLIINNSRFVPEERAPDPASPRTRTDIYTVGPNFFETMGMSLTSGRDFRPDEPADGGVAVVNDAFANAAFPRESPLGRRVIGDGRRLQIVGVVATAKSRTVDEAPRPSIYVPALNTYMAAQAQRGVTLIAKTASAPAAYAAPLRDAIHRADPSLAVFDVRTMDTQVRDALLLPRVAGMLSTIAGSIGLALAAIGVYGVISFAVARRRREIGIRLAVGARPREVLMMIVKQGLTLVWFGMLLGFLAGLSLTRFAASLLYGVNPRDAITFAAVPVVLTAVALAACLLPARAAARVDPVDVLRSE